MSLQLAAPSIVLLPLLAPMALAFSIPTSGALTTAETVGVYESAYLLESGAVQDLESGLARGHEPGWLIGRVDLLSDRQDSTGKYVPPSLRVLWRILDANGSVLSMRADREWYGELITDPLPLTRFDPNTGDASIALRIPFGHHRELPVLPGLPAPRGTIELVLGWSDRLRFDRDHVPVENGWHARVECAATWPDQWLEVDARSVAVDGTVACFLALSRQVEGDAAYTLSCTVGGRVSLPDSVIVPSGASVVRFVLEAGPEPGLLKIQASRSGDVVATSPSIRIERQGSSSVEVGSTVAAGVVGSWKFNRECHPPSCDRKPVTTYKCSGCFSSEEFTCSKEPLIFINPVSCSLALLDACLVGGSHVAHLKCTAYLKIDEFTQSCIVGERKCCVYKSTGLDGTATVPSCI